MLIAGDALETIGHLGCSEITRLSACGLAFDWSTVLQPAPASLKSCPTPAGETASSPPADAGRGIDPSLDPSFTTNLTVPTVGNSLIDDTSSTYHPKERGQEIWSSPLIHTITRARAAYIFTPHNHNTQQRRYRQTTRKAQSYPLNPTACGPSTSTPPTYSLYLPPAHHRRTY